jgi:hypothetical protein
LGSSSAWSAVVISVGPPVVLRPSITLSLSVLAERITSTPEMVTSFGRLIETTMRSTRPLSLKARTTRSSIGSPPTGISALWLTPANSAS